MQELKAFLELEGPLADNYQWRQLHPMQGSLMEGLSRLPKQLLGARQSPANDCCVQVLRQCKLCSSTTPCMVHPPGHVTLQCCLLLPIGQQAVHGAHHGGALNLKCTIGVRGQQARRELLRHQQRRRRAQGIQASCCGDGRSTLPASRWPTCGCSALPCGNTMSDSWKKSCIFIVACTLCSVPD